jgi:DNA polymerase-4
MDSGRKIIHIDMDAFYASIEQRDNPRLRAKPVIVGGHPSSRGVVAACSYEARAYGIHSAMACAQAYRLCPRAEFITPRMARYKEVSERIMAIFANYTDLVEPLSLDEAYLDITENKLEQQSATLLATTICNHIVTETGLTASAGVSCNKFVAKIASGLRKPNGISVIEPTRVDQFIAGLPIHTFHGVGAVTAAKMKSLGIHNGHDLRGWSREKLITHFGKQGDFYYNIARGIDTRPVNPERIRKSIGAERTLAQDTTDTGFLMLLLEQLAQRVHATAHRFDFTFQTVTLKLRYHDFTTITRSSTTPHAMTSIEELIEVAGRLFKQATAKTRKIRLIGVSIGKLQARSSRKPRQLSLPFQLR